MILTPNPKGWDHENYFKIILNKSFIENQASVS